MFQQPIINFFIRIILFSSIFFCIWFEGHYYFGRVRLVDSKGPHAAFGLAVLGLLVVVDGGDDLFT